MAANRKHQSAAVRFGPLVKAALLCLLLAGSGVGYVWQKDQIDRLGKEWRVREGRRDQLIRENEHRRKQLAQMRSPAFLELRIKELGLGLVPPQPAQVLRLPDPLRELPRDGTRLPASSQYASREVERAGP